MPYDRGLDLDATIWGAIRHFHTSLGREFHPVPTPPGLAMDQLHEGRDLLHTTDFRDVLGELVRVHLGNPNLQSVLPDHQFTPVGLIA